MTSEPSLTRRQQAIYDYLLARRLESSQPPTLDEVCHALQLSSRGSMHKQIQALVAAGLVEPMNRKQRGIRLRAELEMQAEALSLMGYIAAGKPIEALENPEAVEVPERLRTDKPCFVLEVRGDSMVEEGILDGDWVVVEQRDTARNGELVVALIDRTEATLKRIIQRPSDILLVPANSTMEPMSYTPDRVQIQGVVVGQMRAYR